MYSSMAATVPRCVSPDHSPEIVASPVVRAAYLGDSEVEAAVQTGHTIEEVAG